MNTATSTPFQIITPTDFLDRVEIDELSDALRATVPGEYCRLSDGITRYEVQGPEDGPVIIMIPGATGPFMVFDPLMKPLADAGFRVVRFDLYGRGYSDRPKVDYNGDLFNRQMFELVEALNLKGPLNIIGMAFGAVIGLLLADKYPERVNSLCFIAPDGLDVKLSLGLKLSLRFPFIGELLFRRAGDRILLPRLLEYTENVAFIDTLKQAFLPSWRIKGFRYGLLSSIRHIPVHAAQAYYERLNKTGKPVKIVWGDKDEITPFSSAVKMKQIMPNAEFETLEGCGHCPQFEKPDLVSDVIVDFMRRVT